MTFRFCLKSVYYSKTTFFNFYIKILCKCLVTLTMANEINILLLGETGNKNFQ